MWSCEGIPKPLKNHMTFARERLGDIEAIHLDGHPTIEHITNGVGKNGNPVSLFNVLCDERCQMLTGAYKTLTFMRKKKAFAKKGKQ